MSRRPALIQQIRMALRELTPSLGRLNDVIGSVVQLNGADIEVLDHIGRFGPMSPGDVAEAMSVHPATMTGILDRLEKGGWVVRERATDDRRRVSVKALRERAPELVRLYQPMNTAVADICEGLTVQQMETVLEFLRSVSDAASDAVTGLEDAD
jgi:DNA-binding MarR family transcriptional regulator